MNNVPWHLVLLILTTAQLFTDAANTTQLLDTIFIRYYGSTVEEFIDAPLEKAASLLTKMNISKPTALYIHGFTESTESESVTTVVDAYIHRGDHNILAADYRNISSLSYLQLTKSVSEVGAAIAGALDEMIAAGLNKHKIHVIGHSMGAQVASHVGNKTKDRLPRITGLDPAGPLFNFYEAHLSSKDADFVDIIHTDYGFYGIGKVTGSVDFFPNRGRRVQPGCPLLTIPLSMDDFCSHHRSWRFYAESLLDEKAFIAVKCSSQLQFVTGYCKNNEKVVMGYATPKDTKGTFYLTTGADSPFGRKENGTRA